MADDTVAVSSGVLAVDVVIVAVLVFRVVLSFEAE